MKPNHPIKIAWRILLKLWRLPLAILSVAIFFTVLAVGWIAFGALVILHLMSGCHNLKTACAASADPLEAAFEIYTKYRWIE